MHRLLFDKIGGDKIESDEIVAASDTTIKHIKALRLRIGELVEFISFEDRKLYVSAFENKEKQNCGVLRIQHVERVEPECPMVHLFQATPELKKLEQVAQKTVEAGVHGIYIVSTQYSDKRAEEVIIRATEELEAETREGDRISLQGAKSKKKEKSKKEKSLAQKNKLARLKNIVLSAALQSKASVLPTFEFCGSLLDIDFSSYDKVLFFYEGAERSAKTLVSSLSGVEKIAIIIGSEGGFSKEEAEELGNRYGMYSLGKRILRTETAAIPAISIAIHEASK